MRTRSRLVGGLPVRLVCPLAVLCFGLVPLLSAQLIHRDGFSGREPVWLQGPSDARFTVKKHELSEEWARSLPTAEHLSFTTELGTFIHYHYTTPPAPLSETLTAAVWLKANRTGMQLLVRLVLPHERNPDRPDEPLTVLLPGDVYRLQGKWQRLSLPQPMRLARQQTGVIVNRLKRSVNLDDAYVDRVVLNVYGSPGQTEVWIDDLEIGPVREPTLPPVELPSPAQTSSQAISRPHSTRPAAGQGGVRPDVRGNLVEFKNNQLHVNGERFFVRGIRQSKAPLAVLRQAGFNTIWFDDNTPDAVLNEAINQRFWIVPTLPLIEKRPTSSRDTLVGGRRQATEAELITARINRFSPSDGVLFWHLGSERTAEQVESVSQTIAAVRTADPHRPTAIDAWDGFEAYSNQVELLGVHRWPLMTSLELTRYRDWLTNCRNLATPNKFMWTWIQTHLPRWYLALNNQPADTAQFADPVGPQPEQIRLLANIALGTGCRGLAFWSDDYLADSHHGRDRLQALALINREIVMLEPLLLTLAEPPQWIDTDHPNIKGSVMRCAQGTLVLLMWIGDGAQHVPGQAASRAVSVLVPQAPEATQAWQVTPGSVRTLRCVREVGGLRVTIPHFDLTTAIVFTSDTHLVSRWQQQVREAGPTVTKWVYDQVVASYQKVLAVHNQLEQLAPPVPDAALLLADSQRRLQRTREAYERREYELAYSEANAAARPLRILMRSHWDNAVRGLGHPTASPYAISFFTLPKHWQLFRDMQDTRPGRDLLTDGHFEPPGTTLTVDPHTLKGPDGQPAKLQPEYAATDPKGKPVPEDLELLQPLSARWTQQKITIDGVELHVGISRRHHFTGQHSLALRINPPQPSADEIARGKRPQPPPRVLERTFLAAYSPPVQMQPGSIVRISGRLKIPEPIRGSADGALFFDSIGGEPLAVRLTEPTNGWRAFYMYRVVPANGLVSVAVALTGIGRVYVDDLLIEPMLQAGR